MCPESKNRVRENGRRLVATSREGSSACDLLICCTSRWCKVRETTTTCRQCAICWNCPVSPPSSRSVLRPIINVLWRVTSSKALVSITRGRDNETGRILVILHLFRIGKNSLSIGRNLPRQVSIDSNHIILRHGGNNSKRLEICWLCAKQKCMHHHYEWHYRAMTVFLAQHHYYGGTVSSSKHLLGRSIPPLTLSSS